MHIYAQKTIIFGYQFWNKVKIVCFCYFHTLTLFRMIIEKKTEINKT